MPVTLRSYSKINLGLAIGPMRPDGFHALTTLYQTLEAHDLVTVAVTRQGVVQRRGSSRRRGVARGRMSLLSSMAPSSTTPLSTTPRIELSCNVSRVPLDTRNTVWKMLAQALAGPGREGLWVKVHIEKRLPVQGGLGGGSANAAAALIGLEREIARHGLALPLTGEERLRFAAEVGSDVPLFLLGGSVLGLGRGEEVVPLADLATFSGTVLPVDAVSSGVLSAGELPAAELRTGPLLATGHLSAVVALPEEGVSTPAAFRAWDAQQLASGLTPGNIADRLVKLSRALASAWCEQLATGVLTPKAVPRNSFHPQDLASTLLTLVQTGILLNDFEQVVFRQHPLLEQIRRVLTGELAGEQALYAALSGSGSAVFGLYPDDAVAERATERLKALGLRSLRTHTLGRADYWAGMVVHED